MLEEEKYSSTKRAIILAYYAYYSGGARGDRFVNKNNHFAIKKIHRTHFLFINFSNTSRKSVVYINALIGIGKYRIFFHVIYK